MSRVKALAMVAVVIGAASLAACAADKFRHRVVNPEPPLSRIVVIRDDRLTRPYDRIGKVEGEVIGDQQGCRPDDIRIFAYRKYGNAVDAVVNFANWREDSYTFGCDGTAVRFAGSSSND